MDRSQPRGFAIVGLDRPKDHFNVGGALRAAHCFGAVSVAVAGARFQRSSADTTKAWRHMPILQGDDLMALVPYACVPVAVEITDAAVPLETFEHPPAAFYVFGPEDGSIRAELLKRCRHVVRINTRFCLNLAAAVNVVLYDRQVKLNPTATLADVLVEPRGFHAEEVTP
jgi:tRNA(Leu) C34 or U34 (ribose-2'-O)-methylase TrmL